MTNLYSKYIKEREGIDTVVHENGHGYATYKKLDDGSYYLIDIFVEKEYRRSHIATQLSEQVKQIALADKATTMLGSVCLTTNGVTESLKAVLGDGFKYSHASNNTLYFKKEIKE